MDRDLVRLPEELPLSKLKGLIDDVLKDHAETGLTHAAAVCALHFAEGVTAVVTRTKGLAGADVEAISRADGLRSRNLCGTISWAQCDEPWERRRVR